MLHLEAQAHPPAHDQKVQLGSGMQAPEEALPRMSAESARELSDCEALPGRAPLGMPEQIVARAYP